MKPERRDGTSPSDLLNRIVNNSQPQRIIDGKNRDYNIRFISTVFSYLIVFFFFFFFFWDFIFKKT